MFFFLLAMLKLLKIVFAT